MIRISAAPFCGDFVLVFIASTLHLFKSLKVNHNQKCNKAKLFLVLLGISIGGFQIGSFCAFYSTLVEGINE